MIRSVELMAIVSPKDLPETLDGHSRYRSVLLRRMGLSEVNEIDVVPLQSEFESGLNPNGVGDVRAVSDRLLNQTLQRLNGVIGFAVECGKAGIE